MTEETQAGAAPEAQPETGAPETPQPAYDRGDLEARLRNEPDFAVEQYKKVQAHASRLEGKIKEFESAERAIQAARELGQGDLKAGAESAYQHLVNYSRLLGDAKMSKFVNQWLQTGRGPDPSAGDWDAPEEPPDPREEELSTLRQTVARLEGKTAKSELRSHLDTFFQGEVGQVLSPEERGEVLRTLDEQFGRWQATDAGRQQLGNLSGDTIELLVSHWLSKQGKLGEIGERIHLRKMNARRGAATDGPSPVPTASSGRDLSKLPTSEAVREYARELGYDLHKPPALR